MTTTKKLLVLLALAVGACRADNRSAITILGVAAPSSETDCTYAAGGEFQLGAGVLDVSTAYDAIPGVGAPQYDLFLYVNNDLADPTTLSGTGSLPSKSWYADGARIRVNPASYVNQYHPNPPLLSANIPDTFLPADGQAIQVAGKSVIMVRAVSPQAGLMLRELVPPGGIQDIILGITLQGRTADGLELDSGEWYYPLQVCNGCLAIPTTCTTALVFSCSGPRQDVAPVCAE